MPIVRAQKRTRNSSADPEEFRAPLTDHLEELRVRIIRSLAAVVVSWLVGWYLTPLINKLILTRVMTAIRESVPKGTRIDTFFTNATQPFLVLLRQSFMVGLCLCLPFIVVQIWGFVAPGLKDSEKKPVRSALPFSIGLFFLGVYFCWLVLPSAFQWFASFLDQFQGAGLNQNPEELVSFCVKMMAAFGICFQLPLIVYALGRIGLLSPDTMMKYWRQATVFIFFVAAAITPSNDPISMLMMAIPLCILFVISVYAVKWTAKSKPETTFDDLD